MPKLFEFTDELQTVRANIKCSMHIASTSSTGMSATTAAFLLHLSMPHNRTWLQLGNYSTVTDEKFRFGRTKCEAVMSNVL